MGVVGRAKDPTANAAARNVDGLRKDACVNYREDGQPARFWTDRFTLRMLERITVEFTDDSGERHRRFSDKMIDLLNGVAR